jgi:hypothetical protein
MPAHRFRERLKAGRVCSTHTVERQRRARSPFAFRSEPRRAPHLSAWNAPAVPSQETGVRRPSACRGHAFNAPPLGSVGRRFGLVSPRLAASFPARPKPAPRRSACAGRVFRAAAGEGSASERASRNAQKQKFATRRLEVQRGHVGLHIIFA